MADLKVLAIGNSITDGDPPGGGNEYPAQLQAQLIASGHSAVVVNAGADGQTTNQRFAVAAGLHTNNYDPSKTNIAIIWESSNSFYYGETLEGEKTNLNTFYDYFTSRGWLVLAGTVIQRGTTGSGTIQEWQDKVDVFDGVNGLNPWIRNGNSNADGHIDFAYTYGSDGVFNTPFTGLGNSTYFLDSAHPTTLGHTGLATMAHDAIVALLNSLYVKAVQLGSNSVKLFNDGDGPKLNGLYTKLVAADHVNASKLRVMRGGVAYALEKV